MFSEKNSRLVHNKNQAGIFYVSTMDSIIFYSILSFYNNRNGDCDFFTSLFQRVFNKYIDGDLIDFGARFQQHLNTVLSQISPKLIWLIISKLVGVRFLVLLVHQFTIYIDLSNGESSSILPITLDGKIHHIILNHRTWQYLIEFLLWHCNTHAIVIVDFLCFNKINILLFCRC